MININNETCIGCGACVAVCPDVLEMGEDGKARVKEGANMDAECVQAAKDSCPVQAITI